MNIRKATLKDAKEIIDMGWSLNKMTASFGEYHKPKKNALKEYDKTYPEWIANPEYFVLIAEDNKQITGYVIGRIEMREPIYEIKACGKIIAMFVKKEYRQKGIARLLTLELSKIFKKKKVKYLELGVGAQNTIGVAAWTKIGFQPDTHIMIKKLQ